MGARHATYANYPAGMVDETDLLLLQQHFGELNARKEKKQKRETDATHR